MDDVKVDKSHLYFLIIDSYITFVPLKQFIPEGSEIPLVDVIQHIRKNCFNLEEIKFGDNMYVSRAEPMSLAQFREVYDRAKFSHENRSEDDMRYLFYEYLQEHKLLLDTYLSVIDEFDETKVVNVCEHGIKKYANVHLMCKTDKKYSIENNLSFPVPSKKGDFDLKLYKAFGDTLTFVANNSHELCLVERLNEEFLNMSVPLVLHYKSK